MSAEILSFPEQTLLHHEAPRHTGNVIPMRIPASILVVALHPEREKRRKVLLQRYYNDSMTDDVQREILTALYDYTETIGGKTPHASEISDYAWNLCVNELQNGTPEAEIKEKLAEFRGLIAGQAS